MAYVRKSQRTNGNTFYRAIWHTTATNGDRSQHSKSFTRASEAKAFAIRMETEVERRGVADPDKQIVAGYLKRWIAHLTQRGALSPATINAYQGSVNRLAPYIGHIALAKLAVHHLDDAYAQMLSRPDKPLSGRTVLTAHRVAHAAFEQARKWKLIPENPAKDATAPTPNKSWARAMTEDEVSRLWQTAQTTEAEGKGYPGIAAVVAVFLTTGIRRSELLALQWSAVDLEAGKITINKTVVCGVGSTEPLLRDHTKTEGSVRTIALPGFVVEQLRRHKVFIATQRLAWGKDYAVSLDLVFPVAAGGLMEPRRMTNYLARLMRRAGIEGAQPCHASRHTMATSLLMDDNVNVKTVSSRLGHTTITTTMNMYVHTAEKHDKAAADAIGARFASLSKE